MLKNKVRVQLLRKMSEDEEQGRANFELESDVCPSEI